MSFRNYTQHMTHHLKIALFIGFVSMCLNANAQSQGQVYLPNDSFKVFANSIEKSIGFSGGFNAPQFSIADLNNDGKNDLVVYERQGNQVLTFLNTGTAGSPNYKFEPKYAQNFPLISSYLIMQDYNCDGIADLFERGLPGFQIYKGYYNSSNELCFKFYKGLWYQDPPNGLINAYIDPGDVPGIVDIDGDGDLDFLAFYIGGSHIQLYKNLRVENNLPCDSVIITIGSKCWGKVSQGGTMEQTIGVYCASMMTTNNDGNPNENPNNTAAKTTHTGNNLCFFDADGDGDVDYLNGGVSYSYIQFLKNGKHDYGYPVDSIVGQDTTWQSGGHIYNTSIFPAAFYVDIDYDGKKDVLISPSTTLGSENYRCIAWYKNTGTASTPVFTYKGDSLLSGQTIDMGAGAYPMIFDYDRDGKPDLFVGGDGYYQSNGILRSKIAFYKNTSTTGNPSFTLVSDDFLNLFASNVYGAYPAVGDLDNDGREDLVIAHKNGKISFYKDTSTGLNTPPSWVLVTDTLRDMNNIAIDSTQYPAPFIYDVDTDGKKDLVLGTMAGWLFYYKNVGTSNQVKLQYVTGKLGKAKSDSYNAYSGYAAPFIGKIDNTGNDYLLMGSNSGSIYKYTNFKGATNTTIFNRLDTMYSYINSYQTINYPYSGLRSVPAVADFDGDGKYEMVVGNILGGLQMFKQAINVGITNTPEAYNPNVVLYPNPSHDFVNIDWDPSFVNEHSVTVSLYSITGQLISSQIVENNNACIVNLKSLSTGLYQCLVASGSNRKYFKVLKMD